MPAIGAFKPGDTIDVPKILIPGQETDNPNTLGDERQLRTVPEPYTLPDYDQDGSPDEAAPEPQNPSVPTASSDPPPSGESGEGGGSQPTDDDIWSELDEINNPLPEISAEARAIANGHAYNEHREEFPEIETQDEFARLINEIMNSPSEVKQLSNGRTAYWDDISNTLVITAPGVTEGGTAFRPTAGKEYFNNLR